MKSVGPIVIVIATAAAGVANASPRYFEKYDLGKPLDKVDDVDLSQVLRAAFGKGVTVCNAKECTTEIIDLRCEMVGHAAKCTAIDHQARDRAVTATGAIAERLLDHLVTIGADKDPGRIGTAR